HAAALAEDTPSRRLIFVCRPQTASEDAPCANRIVTSLATRAFRRPPTAEDMRSLLSFYEAGRGQGGFELGVERALERILVSPQFLFRIEQNPPMAGAMARVTELELASRLSFFLWSSIPDDELRDLAVRGQLRQPGVLARQVRRMLADPRSRALVN